MRKFWKSMLAALSMLVFGGILMLIFSQTQSTVFPLYRRISAAVERVLSAVTGIFPFAVWELCLLLLLIGFLLGLIRVIRRRCPFRRWFTALLHTVTFLTMLFVVLWGLNHYAPPLSEELGLTIEEYTEDELAEAAQYYMDRAETYAELCERDEDGTLVLPDLKEMAEEAGQSYLPLSAYSVFSGCGTAPVKLGYLTSTVFDYFGTTGIFICWTGESTVNPDTASPSMAHTMCHEVAHRCGIAGEDEANFAAFLACKESDDVNFRYSGYYSAFIYCYNALYKQDASRARALWTSDYETLRQDCNAASAHYEPYEGKVQDTAQKMNDVYLKAFSEESGVQSYGEAADYLIAWYLERVQG